MRITPWRDQREWERVRDLFYSQDPAMIQLASDRVRAWACRGRVAHAVISTHLLTAALQMRGSSLECRMVLAMALTRFVNGLLDPAQQAEHAISMVALARQLDLPESFVELRHATTHDALPSLVVLKQAAMRARDWLWQHYWQPVAIQDLPVKVDEVTAAHVTDIVKQWRKLRKSSPQHELKVGSQDQLTRDSLTILKQVGAIKQSRAGAEIWVTCLCTSKAMLHRDTTHALWDPLLDRVIACQPHFRQVMLESGSRALGTQVSQPGVAALADDPVLSRLKDWMLLLAQREADDALDPPAVLKSLCLERDLHTAELLKSLVSVQGFSDAARYARLRGIELDELPVQVVLPEKVIESTADGRWIKHVATNRAIGFLDLP